MSGSESSVGLREHGACKGISNGPHSYAMQLHIDWKNEGSRTSQTDSQACTEGGSLNPQLQWLENRIPRSAGI